MGGEQPGHPPFAMSWLKAALSYSSPANDLQLRGLQRGVRSSLWGSIIGSGLVRLPGWDHR
jgi:hypothetical protein